MNKQALGEALKQLIADQFECEGVTQVKLADGATVRVQLDAARVTGTPLNACFGDFDLRIHKELDPVVDLDHTFDAPPTQRLPASHAEWVSAWPNIAPPNAALYAGRSAFPRFKA